MTTKKKPVPLRDQIIRFLLAKEEATAKHIAAATTERDFPSRVTAELNKLRTDAIVECEKKKGKNELWYWLAAKTSGDSQPAVEQNTGSSAADDSNAPPAAGAAVQPEPAPEAAAPLSADPVAVDEIPQPQYDPDEVVFERTGDPAEASVLERIRSVLRPHVYVGDPAHAPSALECARSAAACLVNAGGRESLYLSEIQRASETLAPLVRGDIDASDMELHELAENVAAQLAGKDAELLEQARLVVKLRDTITNRDAQLANQTALVEKLEHLLQSARNDAEHLRRHADAAGADMVNHPPHYQGKVECIDAIEAALGADGFAAYCRGNAIKYSFRAGRKGPAGEDLAKARWYLERVPA